MNISKLRNSTAIDKALGTTAVNNALKIDVKDDDADRVRGEKPTLDVASKGDMTADRVSMYLKHVSASSCGEIDSLISDLSSLRQKLIADGGRIEHAVVEFATLNQSVIKLTEVVSDGVVQVKTPSPAV